MHAYVATPLLVALFAAYVWARREIARTRERRAVEKRRRQLRRAIDRGDLEWGVVSERSLMRAGEDPELMTRQMRTVWKPGDGKHRR